jgi:heat shock protein HtpX
VTTAVVCPRCTEPTVTLGLTHSWCAACGWNLDRSIPSATGWKWLDRRLHRLASRLTDSQFEALADGPIDRRSATAARLVTLAAALVMILFVLAIAVAGLWLLIFEPGFVSKLLGAILIGVAVVLRPRLNRLSAVTEDAQPIDRKAAPELFGLVERVANEVGAPLPQLILISYEMNAFTTTVGLRAQRVLSIGLPLWATLEPQERVALLGHELAHFVNGDVRRAPLAHVAETTLTKVATIFRPTYEASDGLIGMLTSALSRAVARLISVTALLLQAFLYAISQRDSQRAEYLADELGAQAAGTEAAIHLADHLLLRTPIETVIHREARAGNGMPAWHEAAQTARSNQASNIPLLRRLSRHTQASVWASHPPNGLRAEMLQRRPSHTPAVTLDAAAAARIDAELTPFTGRVRRALAEAAL